VRILDESTAFAALDDPLAFRERAEPRELASGELRLELGAYGVARVDVPAW
jgi:hypothetical protein